MDKKRPIRRIFTFKTFPELVTQRVSRPACISLLALLSLGCADRALTAEVSAAWAVVVDTTCAEQWRDEDERRYCSAALDFDGDGIPDTARLVTGPGGRIGVALWGTSFKERGPLVIFTPREIRPQLQSGAALGIKRLSPGTYETLCGKGLDICSDGDARELVVRNDAILLFKEDSWGDVVYLDKDGSLKLFAHSD